MSREEERAALRNTLLPTSPVPDPTRPVRKTRTAADLLEQARAEFVANPTIKTHQDYLAAGIFEAIVRYPTSRNIDQLTTLLLTPEVSPLPEKKTDHPIPLALRRLRQAKTEEGKAKNEELLNAAHLEMRIRAARSEGLAPVLCEQLADVLLRRVTSSS